MPNNETMTFRNVGTLWRRIDNQEPCADTLAETLTKLNIIIDDSTQFCRIIRYFDEYYQTITYKAYNMSKVTITITYNKY